MADPRSRAQHLIVEIRRARLLRDRLASDGEDTSQIDAHLDELHRKLGAHVVEEPELAATIAPLIPDAQPSQESFTDELPPARDHGWYDDEKTGPIDSPSGPLFDSGDLETGDIPIPDDLHLPPESDDTDAGEQYAVESIGSLAAHADDPTTGLGAFRAGRAPFGAALQDLLDLLRSPFDLDDPAELGVEASRVQWAASEFERRTRDLPADVRVALLGLLSARAQHLRTRLDVDVGIRLSLDRLQRCRIEQSLPSVHGLLPTPLPELNTWLEDSEAWWAVLQRPGDP
jgi:hypothetical protein